MFGRLSYLVLCFIALNTAVQGQIKKCSEAPQNICGPNAKCFDDENSYEYRRHNGAYCICDDGFFDGPPKCRPGCRSDYECEDDEYCSKTHDCKKGCRLDACGNGKYCDIEISRNCVDGCLKDYNCGLDEYCDVDDKKCQKICEIFSCGPNSKCHAENHKKYCTCADGFVNEAGKGCIKNQTGNNSMSCSECGERSRCDSVNDITYCFCQQGVKKSPFIACDPTHYLTTTPSRPFLKPGSEESISLQCIISICTG